MKRSFGGLGPIWLLLLANIVAAATVAWITWSNRSVPTPPMRVTPVTFSDLPEWNTSDPVAALGALRRSCIVIASLAPGQSMGGVWYAGTVSNWLPACKALPVSVSSAAQARAYFETWFSPLLVTGGQRGLFTGYYEAELAGSWTKSAQYRIPIYGRPIDLISADLGQFHRALAGQHIAGRLDGSKLVPFAARADINAHGLADAPILLYTDDPVSLFFLHIQGSGRVRLDDGSIIRLAFAGTNGRPYTAIGRVLITRGALERGRVSLQTIRAWLESHKTAEFDVMEQDQSFVFFEIAPLGDPTLGSSGTEGVALTPTASLAVDSRLHPLGAPVYVSTTLPEIGPRDPGHSFNRLLIAQDTGGAINGASRGDIFFGSGRKAEALAGRMQSRGRLFVFVPKSVALALAPFKEFPDAPP